LGRAEVRFTGRAEGDQRTGPEPWTRLRQVHGNRVVVVDEPGGASGSEADGAVTRAPGAALAILTADCAPVVFVSDEGVVGAAHAGWKGLRDGVLANTVRAMCELGATHLVAALGPCIHAECYEFGVADLDAVAGAVGDHVRGVTSWGAPALDLPAGVRAALAASDVELVYEAPACTACSPDCFSFRARQDAERQATVVWMP
jgi:YfiH family protein